MITRSDIACAALGAGLACVLLAGDSPWHMALGVALLVIGVILAPQRLTN